MKKRSHASRILNLVLAGLIGFTAGLSGQLRADDTEIYLGDDSLTTATRSNVLFILDTSGSMSGTDKTKPSKSRLVRMKEALHNLLDNINNVNVGLMRFTNPGGPILYPVSYIDEADSEVLTEKIPEVQVSITDSADDAAELRCVDIGFSCDIFDPAVGTMNLDDAKLEVTGVSGFGTNDHIELQIAQSSDDAESQHATNMVNSGKTLDLTTNGGTERRTGLRFQNLTIPPKATILHAELDFYAKTDRSETSNWTIRAHDVGDSPTFPNAPGANDIESRMANLTTAAVDWNNIPTWATGDRYQTPELKDVVQEVVSRADWADGNDLSFIITGTFGSRRDAASFDELPAKAPILRIDYAVGDGGIQRIGMRFNGVNVPQGVTILNAWLELTPSEDSDPTAPDTKLKLYAENSGNAAAFTTGNFDISSRPQTTETQWDLDSSNNNDDWFADSPVVTPNLKDLVQDVVDRSDWCGGNSMAFFLMWDGERGPRTIHTFDGDASYAPKLRIDYDQGSLASLAPGEGCMVKDVQYQIKEPKDDAEQRTDETSVNTTSSDLDMMDVGSGKKIAVGLRFQDIKIKKNAKILKAEIEFTAKDSHSSAADFWIYGHATDDADKFEKGSGKDVTSRPKTSAATKVQWTVPAWTKNQKYSTPDISALVQEIVDRGGWVEGNDIAFILDGDGVRKAYTQKDPAKGAVLRITTQGEIGSGTAGSVVTVRQRLHDIVDDLNHGGGTPIVDTLYEAALYYRGEALEYGDTRNNKKQNRVSHPASYTGGTVDRDPKCTDENLSDGKCASEHIDGSPIYTSPIEPQVCQSNFIVLLTDGQANNNHSVDEVKTMIGGSCMDKFSNGDNVGSGEECGADLTKFLYEEDQSDVDGKNSVTTYTIGFNFTGQFIKQVAEDGGGEFYEASTADQLTAVFNQILDDVQDRTTSFATPALSVNAFNKLFHRNEVFFSLFTPGRDMRWEGNVKKYQLCESTAAPSDCSVLGEVLDFDSPRKPAIGADERIADDAISDWSVVADGPDIMAGGAGNTIPTHTARKVYTYTAGGPPDDVDLGGHLVEDGNTDITVGLLGGSTVTTDSNYMSPADRTKVLNWMRGMDVMDEDVDGDETEDRYAFHDPLHSSPVAVTFGGTDADPVIKLFVGTNDGGLRMINTYNGTEEWIFFPQQMLAAQRALMNNPVSSHFYGMDATPTMWINDENGDSIIDPDLDVDLDGTKEFVRAIVGMRRGGSNYYAIEVRPTSGPLNTPSVTNGTIPRLLWRIDGGIGDFPRLGQTWSQPKLTTMLEGTTSPGESAYKRVMVFAGGYEDGQDSGFAVGDPGNAIYVVDPETGARLFWISSYDHGGTDGVVVPDMTYPIPSDVALMDSNGDGATDRIYVGDTGGQVWRVDIGADVTTSSGFKATVGKLATVSDPFELEDQRKFFYAPDVVRVTDSAYSSIGNYDLVTIASGNRSHPLNTDVKDRFYAFRDYHQAPLVDGDPATVPPESDDDGLADGYTTLQGKTVALAGDLFDVTSINDPAGTDLTNLEAADGYFIDLEGLGEKGLSSPIILAGTVFFTSYTPEDVLQISDCSLAEGGGTVYAFNVLNGAAVFNWDGIGDDTNLTTSDRSQTLGAGIPSSAVPIFQEEGISILIGGGGGAKTIDPDLALPRARTYWGQEE